MLRSHSALSSAVRCLCGVSLFTLLPATAAFAQDGGTSELPGLGDIDAELAALPESVLRASGPCHLQRPAAA